jgi:hypothetical protein
MPTRNRNTAKAMEAYFSVEPQKQLADNGFILRSMTEKNL